MSNVDRKNKIIKIILISVIIVTICFIWGQSCLSVEDSSKESAAITENIIQKIEECITGEKTISDNMVRKWAHGVEFCVLGLELSLFFFILNKKPLRSIISTVSLGPVIAFLDESIQLFSDRGSQVIDIWIDILGLVIGTAVCIASVMIVSFFKKKKSKARLDTAQ